MQPGDTVADRFVIESRAGAGGMGEVFRARDRQTGEAVALKVLLDAGADAGRFAREARLLAELDHPGVVRHVAHGQTTDGRRWLAMEWLEGHDLGERLARAPLPAPQSVELVRRAASALGAAHARGIVHRDVKPENLFLPGGDPAQVKLLDFGIARAGGGALSTRALTRTGAMVGTPAYMSPEQARGERDIDARADVFSLGCVLFECLAGRPAFAGEHLMAVLAKILFEQPPRLDEIVAGAPPALVELVARMLAKSRSDRPADGAEVARALGALGALGALRAAAPSARPPAVTPGEQQLVSVVLATPPGAGSGVDAEAATVAAEAATVAAEPPKDVEATARWVGATLERLADGTLVSVLAGPASVERGARLALALAARHRMRVALATGRAQIEGHLPVGEAIDQAARLLRVATTHPIAGESARALLAGRFEFSGASLLRELPPRDGSERTLLGRPTTFVGRDAELRMLESWWDACIDEAAGRVVLVTAPAGVGKSRLASELVRAVRARGGAEIWIAHADVMRAGSPLGLIKEALMSTAGMRHGEPRERLRDKIRARVARHVPEAAREHTTMFLGELTGAEFDDGAFLPLRTARSDAMVMADNVRRAWEQLVRAECAAHPLLLVYDDLQWGDAATVSFTDSALRNLGEHPMLVLALARPEVHEAFPGLWSERGMQEIKLMPLSRKASEKLAREALGPSASAPVIAQVVERAAGNAFFLEELIRAAAEGKSDEVPVSVLAIVEQRLLSLDAEARRVLRAASVFGRTFWGGGVRALLGGSDPGEWLRVLASAEIVQPRGESRFEGEVEHAFRHDVVRAAAYAMLTEADRVLGHRLAAEWLERAGERDALLVAEHFEKGGERARAASWFLRAAEQAFEGNDLAAALGRAERGAACGAEGETLGELRRLQAEVHHWAGENEAALRRAREAMERFAPGAPGWLEAARCAIVAAQRLGRAADAVSLAAALEAVTEVPPGAAIARACALWSAARNLLYVGERDRAARLASCAGETDDLGAQAFRAEYQAYSALLAGDVGAALDALSRAQALHERAGDKRRSCHTLGNVGYAQALLGDDARAEATLRRALDEARAMGLRNVEAGALQNLGPVLGRLGRAEEAARTLRESIEALAAQGNKRMEGGSRTYLAEILLAAGNGEAARAEALRAVELLASAPPVRPYALAVLARAERRSGDAARARALAEEAMQEVALVEDGEATIRLEHAEALRAAGEPAAAARAIAEARERLLARAARISDPTWRESFLTRLPEHARTLALAAEWVRGG